MAILPDAARCGNDPVHRFTSRPGGNCSLGWLLLPLLLWLAAAQPAAAAAGAAEVAALRQRVAELRATGRLELQGVVLGREDILAEFYARRGYQPAWDDSQRVAGLRTLIGRAAEHGLDPEDFFASHLQEPAQPASGPEARADFDLLLTEALIRYGYQLHFGKVDPTVMEPAWNFRRGFANDADPVSALADAVAAPSLQEYLESRLPGGPWYRQLQLALARYRAMVAAGGWPTVPGGPVLRPGDRDARVPVLRQRLRVEGDLPAELEAADAEGFDADLAAAVQRFQERHALARDGSVGARTLEALNVPAQSRVDQLRLSLERVRWLADDVPDTYVVVNVAGFRVGFVRGHELAWSSRVVVGRAARQTPIFGGLMTYIDLNPTWTVPPTILREDILPKLRRDPGYLARENISVIDRNGRTVDPRGIDWKAYGRSIPYSLRQEPGPANSLGRIKLMFPNRYAVYLHDTPAKTLFDKPERDFSSGCIRVDDPLALAALVLDDPQWDRGALEAAIATGKTRRVQLRKPMPVLLVYLAAVADRSGTVRFYRDVYDRDAALLAALDGPVQLRLPATPVATRGKLGPASL
jgi:murein L,D-transpeptidase YcbB/YkuD